MSRTSVPLVWLVVFALLTSTLSAQTASIGIVHPTGDVSVNGRPTTSSTALFVGETVQTGPTGTVMITASGLNVALGPNGSVRINGSRVELGCGSFVAIDANGPVTVGNYTITPTAGRMRVELAQGARLIVTPRGGPVSVSGDGAAQNVSTGGSFEVEGLPGCTVAPGGSLNPQATAPAAKQSRALLWILLAGGGAGAAVVAASAGGSETERRPVSPSRR